MKNKTKKGREGKKPSLPKQKGRKEKKMFTVYNLLSGEALTFSHFGAAAKHVIKTLDSMEKNCPAALQDVREENNGIVFEIWQGAQLIMRK